MKYKLLKDKLWHAGTVMGETVAAGVYDGYDLAPEFIKIFKDQCKPPVLIELPDGSEGPVEEESESLPPAGKFYETKIIIPETKADPVQKPRKRRARKG